MFPQVFCGRDVHVVHRFIKLATILAFKLKLDLRANMFDGIKGLGALQDDRLKNDHLIGVPLTSSYAIELH